MPFIRLPTIYLSTVSPGPLTAVAQPLSPGASQPYGSRKPGGTTKIISFQGLYVFMGIPHMGYVTLVLPFSAGGDVAKRLLSTAWLFKVAVHRVFGSAKQHSALPGTDIGWKSTFRGVAYSIIPNRRYADGVVVLVRGIYESCRQLGVDFKGAELSDWLMFQQSEMEYPSRSITLKPGCEVYVTTVSYSGESYRDVIRPSVPRSYRALLSRVIEERQEYTGRVMVKGYGFRGNTLWVHGEVHITIPVGFYIKHSTSYREPKGNLIGGVDVNADRINLAVVDRNGNLRDYKTFWFEETTARGYPGRSAWSVIGMRIHEMLEYAYHHGVSTIALENPEVLGRLRLLWVRRGDRGHEDYNYKVSIFKSTVIERTAMKAPLYGLNTAFISPKGTTNSTEHTNTMKRYGLDRHTASAYLIALRGLTYQSI